VLRVVTCPYCWTEFAPEDVLWVSVHSDLRGDTRLGPDHFLRFLPSVFTLEGDAVDLRGQICKQRACPHCHLILPRSSLEMTPMFVSILGTPASGKSFLLASMVWRLRQHLATSFGVQFVDADPSLNALLYEHERKMFMHPEPNRPVPLADLIPKTDLAGAQFNYETVDFGDHAVRLLKPYFFELRLTSGHLSYGRQHEVQRLVCLYDNAGEHFLPGGDSSQAPVTWHLPRSEILIYVLDPTQDPRFRQALFAQVQETLCGHRWTGRQDVVLLEAVSRIRALGKLPSSEKIKTLLLIALTKADMWGRFFESEDLLQEPFVRNGQAYALDSARVADRSRKLEKMLLKMCPEIMAAARANFERVVIVPTSAIGRPPEILETPTGPKPACRPSQIKPAGVMSLFLLGISELVPGLIARSAPS